jgi:hypothetical protein
MTLSLRGCGWIDWFDRDVGDSTSKRSSGAEKCPDDKAVDVKCKDPLHEK